MVRISYDTSRKSLTNDLRDTGKEFFGKEPPIGLEPIGNGFYKTPDVIDPRQCEFYPESIYCGGNPFSNPLTNPIGVDLDGGINECGAFISAKGILAGISLPTHTIAWIKPECRKDYEDLSKPEPPPPISDFNNLPPPAYRPHGFDDNDQVVAVIINQFLSVEQHLAGTSWRTARYSINPQITEASYPSQKLVRNSNEFLHGSTPRLALCDALGTIKVANNLDANWVRWLYQTSPDQEVSPMITETNLIADLRIPWDLPYRDGRIAWGLPWVPRDNWLGYQVLPYKIEGENHYPIILYIGRFGDIFPRPDLGYGLSTFDSGYDARSQTRTISKRFGRAECVFCIKLDGTPPKQNPYKFDPPRKPKRKCCMQCCSSGQQQQDRNDDLLRKILKELQDIKKTVGFEEFPARVPKTFLTAYNNSGKAQAPEQTTINNIPQLVAWAATALEAVLGEMGAVIEIEDTDPTKEGNQGGKVVHKNMSELLLETYSLIFDSWMLNNQLIQLSTKQLIQQSMTHRTNTQNYFALLALVDFFGFKQKEIKKKIPFTVSIGEETLERFMKEKEEEITVLDFDPNDKNCTSYKDDMLELRHMAAMYRAQNYRKLDANGDLGRQTIELLKMGMGYIDKINSGKINPRNPEGEVPNDFDKFCEDAETQFSRITGINPDKPYGVPYSNRPKITKLSEGHTPDSES